MGVQRQNGGKTTFKNLLCKLFAQKIAFFLKILTKKGTFLTFLYFLQLFFAKKYDLLSPPFKKNPPTAH